MQNVGREDAGTYICTANNGVGQEASAKIQVEIKCKLDNTCIMNCIYDATYFPQNHVFNLKKIRVFTKYLKNTVRNKISLLQKHNKEVLISYNGYMLVQLHITHCNIH